MTPSAPASSLYQTRFNTLIDQNSDFRLYKYFWDAHRSSTSCLSIFLSSTRVSKQALAGLKANEETTLLEAKGTAPAIIVLPCEDVDIDPMYRMRVLAHREELGRRLGKGLEPARALPKKGDKVWPKACYLSRCKKVRNICISLASVVVCSLKTTLRNVWQLSLHHWRLIYMNLVTFVSVTLDAISLDQIYVYYDTSGSVYYASFETSTL